MESIFAALDLGSNAIKLKIVETAGNGFSTLEDISVPVKLGEEVFLTGAISLERVNEMVDVLIYYKKILKEYGVKVYKVLGTNALREASNSKNVVELIHMKTGFHVEVVDDTIEKFLTYKSIRDQMENYHEIRKSSLLVEINSGSCDVSMYSGNKLIRNEELNLGVKELKYTLMALEDRTVTYAFVLRELVETRTAHLWQGIRARKPKQFVIVGGDAKHIRELLFKNSQKIERRNFISVVEQAMDHTSSLRNQIESKGTDWYEFLANVIVYDVFLKLVDTEYVLIPDISLRDGMLAELAEAHNHVTRYKSFNNDTYSLTREISKRYKSGDPHIRQVEQNALILFNALASIFEFDSRDSLLIRLAANLHEIGKFTRMKDYLEASYDKISNLNILGVSHTEMLMIAYISRMISSSEMYDRPQTMKRLTDDEQMRVTKLSAILSMADALDKSKKQKLKIVAINLKQDIFEIQIEHTKAIYLEEWSFDFTREAFKNIFGIKPELREI
ncbi:Ppx/GppA phosphatase family protein [Fusibacter tunisiensis]|uniref:Exopolyphosphatase/guanosine-5'-triphosphate, 3'-diphosphate pyrophosphatase n=1 Tax=Fusibacter tunisiensis TaxID=1008308 RepID=A0ABS2MQW0_9FIRM|nr:hypothetical protein [Fusibacter tunisiensis]MBM7561707.1 exopolyphosphatase/guanosine-5'-triphosphate,3'-diphosphate pyrophosphatase [Fusibacter tunisiensis]